MHLFGGQRRSSLGWTSAALAVALAGACSGGVTEEVRRTGELAPTPTPLPTPTAFVEPTPEFDITAWRVAQTVEQDPWSVGDCFGVEDVVPGQIECGRLFVPADWADPDGLEYGLEVVILESTSSDPAPDPVVFLQGGPGAGAIDAVAAYHHELFGRLRADRDVIVIDQRGTGSSDPATFCLSLLGPDAADFSELSSISNRLLEPIVECREELRTQLDLRTLTTAATVADLELLRQVLELDEWNLFGASYGTRVALTAMAQTPEGLRSVILDSVDPTDADLNYRVPLTFEESIAAVAEACKADEACGAAFDDLAVAFPALVAQLDDEPLADVFFSGDIDAPTLLSLTHGLLYQRYAALGLPQILADLSERDAASLDALLTFGTGEGAFSSAVRLAFACIEEVPLSAAVDRTEAISADPTYQRLPGWQIIGRFGPEICDVLGVEPAAAVPLPAGSLVPTFVLAGGFDPITPPAESSRVASALGAAQYVEFPYSSHGVLFDGGCPVELARAFLRTPTAALDTSCVAEIGPPVFVPDAMPRVTLIPFDTANEPLGPFGLSFVGARPLGWDQADYFAALGDVAWYRRLDAADPTRVFVIAGDSLDIVAPFEVVPTVLADLAPVIGAAPEAVVTEDAVVVGDRTWDAGSLQGGVTRVEYRTTTIEGVQVTIVLLARQQEADKLVAEVLDPMLDDLRIEIDVSASEFDATVQDLLDEFDVASDDSGG